MRLLYGDLDLTDYPYLIEFGTDTDAPQNVYETLALLLQDGEVALSSRASNRTLQFNVLIEGADLAELADAEAALILQSERPMNTITIDPGDFGAVGVYETFRGQVTLARDDNGEMARLRRYTVTVQALPFVRSATETVTAALLASGSTTTTLDTMGAATGWTGLADGAAASVVNDTGPPTTNSVSSPAALAAGVHTLTLQKAFAATTTSTKYLTVDWASASSGGSGYFFNRQPILTATGDGVALPPVSTIPIPGTAGYTRSIFKVAASSLAVTRFDASFDIGVRVGGTGPTLKLLIDNVSISDVKPSLGTTRQQQLTVAVDGSARTAGSLLIESTGTVGLGDVLAYTFPSTPETTTYSPALRQFRTAGNTVNSDAGAVSGSNEVIGLGVTLTIPHGQLPPGNYLLMGRMKSTTTTVSADLFGPVETTISVTTAYQVYALGRLILPGRDTPIGSAATQSLTITCNESAVVYDEFWLFNLDIGRLVWVDCLTGTSAPFSEGAGQRRVAIEPASVSTPRPTLRTGHATDDSDLFTPRGTTPGSVRIRGWQTPQFTPPVANLFVVTTNVGDAAVSLRHFARWHTNAAS